MKRRSLAWLLSAVALFALAAFLMRTTKPVSARDKREKRDFPKQLREPERDRLARRQVVLPPRAGAEQTTPKRRDRLLAALPPIPPGESKTALVLEAQAIKGTPIGQMLLDCFRGGRGDSEMKKLGLDVNDVERVAQTDDALLFEGNFDKVDWARAFPNDKTTKLGEHATLHERTDNERTTFVADWGGRYLIGGRDRAAIEATIARLEGQGDETNAAIPDGEAYGEIYGVVSVDRLAQVLGRSDPELADRLRSSANRVELHVDALSDVLIVADVAGPEHDAVGDLGKALGGAISLGRMQAKAEQDDRLSGLLEGARVVPRDGTFQTEIALPLEVLEKQLAGCKKGKGD
jgi:hypothetical protein